MGRVMSVRPTLIILAGLVLVVAGALVWSMRSAPQMSRDLARQAEQVVGTQAGQSVAISFVSPQGSPSRHALLTPVRDLGEGERAAIAEAVAGIRGVGGVHWTDGTMLAEAGESEFTPMHCQDDVTALLDARTIRFEESSADMGAGNDELLDEVAAALRPCLGSIIAINGHTDPSGDEERNLALSRDRAITVREELVARGIPRDGLRARGLGSREPIPGLDPADPANRRIEFSVIAKVPLVPTPVDTPSAR